MSELEEANHVLALDFDIPWIPRRSPKERCSTHLGGSLDGDLVVTREADAFTYDDYIDGLPVQNTWCPA